MNTTRKSSRWLAMLLCIALVLTMLPASAFAAEPETSRGTRGIEDQSKYKYFRAFSAAGNWMPVSYYSEEGGEHQNLIQHKVNTNDGRILLEFGLSHTQNAAISIYRCNPEYCYDSEGGFIKNPMVMNFDPDSTDPEPFLGERLGYIRGVRLDNIDLSDPDNPKPISLTGDEIALLTENVQDSDLKPIDGSYPDLFYGYTGQTMEQLRMLLRARGMELPEEPNITTEPAIESEEPPIEPEQPQEPAEPEVQPEPNITTEPAIEPETALEAPPVEPEQPQELPEATAPNTETEPAVDELPEPEVQPEPEITTEPAIEPEAIPTMAAAEQEALLALLAEKEADMSQYIHNLLVWDGSYMDENGNEGRIQENDLYILVVEPTDPRNILYNSFLGIAVDLDMPNVELSLLDYSTLPEVCVRDPIDLLTGSFTWDYTDFALNGRTNLEFSRHYGSKYAENDYGLGRGWTSNFTYKVLDHPLYAEVILNNGDSLFFDLSMDGRYKSPAGSSFTLEGSADSGWILSHKSGTSYAFNTDGNITAITNLDGESFRYSYAGEHMTSVENDSGSFTFTWSGDHIAAVTDSAGRTVAYTYEGDFLASAVNPDGDNLSYTYNEKGCVESIKDFNGTVYIENSYDEHNRVVMQYVEGQGTSHMTYDPENRTNSVEGENGYFVAITYDEFGRITRYTDNFGTQTYEFNTLHQRTAETDKNGNRTEYSYDENANVTEIRYPDGSRERFTYNENSQMMTYTDGAGGQIKYGYDGNGRVTETRDANGNSRSFAYDGDGNLTSMTDALGNVTTYTYDGAGNCLTATDALGNVTSYTYDDVGRVLTETAADGTVTAYEYTTAGKLVKVTDPAGQVKTYEVNGNGFTTAESDLAGNLSHTVYNDQNQPISVTDRMGAQTTYGYDVEGNLVTETNALGHAVGYSYDAQGRMVGMTDARGNSWSYSYDANDRLIRTTDALSGKSTLTYDSMGRVSVSENARGAETGYSYDDAGRTIAVRDALGNSFHYTYDANGNVIRETDRNGNVTSYTYDSENRLTASKDPEGNTVRYEYDANGRLLKTISAEGNTMSTAYDEVGQSVSATDGRGNTTSYEYDLLGRATKMTNADGTTTGYTYDANGLLLSSVNENGDSWTYTYNKNGSMLTMTDPMGGVTTFTYDAIGQLLSTTDALGGMTSTEYDAGGNIVKETDALGYVTGYVYDALNRLIGFTDAEGRVSTLTYDGVGNITKIVDGDGNTITYTYDLLDQLTGTTDAEGNVVSFVYDANGNLIQQTDGNGNVTGYDYDGLNRPVERTNAEGHKSTVEYDKDGRVVKVVDEEGAVTSYGYDENGNVILVTDALGNSTAMTYDAMNRVTKIVDSRQGTTTFAYTPTGLVAKLTNAEGAATTYTYDKNGNRLSETNGEGEKTVYTYDALNRVLTTTNPNGETVTFAYDAKGQIVSSTDAKGNVTKYVYDGVGNVVKTTDVAGTETVLEYNANGKVVKSTQHRVDGRHKVDEYQTTIYQYDGNNLVTKVIDAAGNETLQVYDGNGNLIQKTDADGYVTEYSYNSLDFVTHINYNGGKEVSYAYNKVGELVEMKDWNGTTTFEVDLLKRITKTTDTKGKVSSFTYDSTGNQTAIVYPDSSVTNYEYDLLGRMTKAVEPENKVTEYRYDLADRLTSMLYPNDWEEFYHYDPAGRLLKVEDTDPSDKVMKTIKHTYTYDANGNQLSEYKRGNGTGSAKEDYHYTYDVLDRVTSAHENYGNVTRGYEYDTLSNLVYETQSGGNKFTDRQYNILNQMVYMTQDRSGKEYMTYEYDNRGNLLNAEYHKGKDNPNKGKGNGSDKGNNQNNNGNKEGLANASYVYDETNKMVKGTNGKGEISLYTRDGLGNLIGNEWIVEKNAYGYHGFDTIEPSVPSALKKHEVVKKSYVLDYTSYLKNVLLEEEEQGLTYRYGYGFEEHKLSVKVSPINQAAGAIQENGAVKLYYHTDYLGTTDYLTSDKTGKVTSWTMYNEWGEITHNAVLKCGVRELDMVKNYTGYDYDAVLDLYYAKNRMYDATNHRFTQLDPIKDGDNWYAYVGNNPVNWTDPLGLAYIIREREWIVTDAVHKRGYWIEKDSYKLIPESAISAGGKITMSLIPYSGIWTKITEIQAGVVGGSSNSSGIEAGVTSGLEVAGNSVDSIKRLNKGLGPISFTQGTYLTLTIKEKDKIIFEFYKWANINTAATGTNAVQYLTNLQNKAYGFVDEIKDTDYLSKKIVGVGLTLYEMDKALANLPSDKINERIGFYVDAYRKNLISNLLISHYSIEMVDSKVVYFKQLLCQHAMRRNDIGKEFKAVLQQK